MNDWLQNFPYRINLNWWIFGLATFVTLVIALLTISVQAIRTAIANPVRFLGRE